jgi:hypothetical protein
MQYTGPAVLVQQCAIWGRCETPVVWFQTSPPKPFRDIQIMVTLTYRRPGQRRRDYCQMQPSDINYLLLEVGRKILYDSRTELPCDKTQWQKQWNENALGMKSLSLWLPVRE